MEVLPLAFTSGWTSGINAYATVLILGPLGRFAGVDELRSGLQRTDVPIAAGLSHLAKAGRRLAIDTSSEPAGNIGAALIGDVSDAAVTAVAVLHPVAPVLVAVLLVAGVWLTVAPTGRVRRGWCAFRRWAQPA
jgi:Domain of unknown function (DUF4126)